MAGLSHVLAEVEIHPHWQINRKHVEIRGCWACRYEHFHRAVELAARVGGQKPWSEMVSRRCSLDDAGAALRAVAERTAIKALTVPSN